MTRVRIDGAVMGAALLLAVHATPASAVVLYDNLSEIPAGTESVSDTLWVAASFKPDNNYKLQSATLLLQMTSSAGQAELDLYSDVPVDPTDPTQGDMPGSLLATLTSPSSYSSSLAPTTFGTNTNVFLNLGAYWLVLKAINGSFDWAYTDSDTGQGVGFTTIWANSYDAGETWATFDGDPQQLRVTALPPVGSGGTLPEPMTIILLATGLAGMRLERRRQAT